MSWWCFSNFDLDMCFAPQQRALFQHLNCQKCAGPEVFCHLEMCSVPQGLHFLNISTSKNGPSMWWVYQRLPFWVRNVLRATKACTFWTSQSQHPKMARACGVLPLRNSKRVSHHKAVHFFILWTSKSAPSMVRSSRHSVCTFWTFQLPKVSDTDVFLTCFSKCASCHNGVHFFDIPSAKIAPDVRCFLYNCVQFLISHLPRWLRARRFSERTRHEAAQKHSGSRFLWRFYFSRTCTCFLLTFFCFWSFFSSLSLFWLFARLLFSFICQFNIVGSLTSKLLSNICWDGAQPCPETIWEAAPRHADCSVITHVTLAPLRKSENDERHF